MALGTIEFHSQALHRFVSFRFILPEEMGMGGKNPHFNRPAKTLVLLHGHENCNEEWLNGSSIKELAYIYNLNVVLPNGENSFYLNQPAARRNYADYVGQELLEYTQKVFGFSNKREDTFVGGLSMGGFGALHTGLAYPENFSKIMALSSALIIHQVAGMRDGEGDPLGDFAYYTSIFGDLSQLEQSPNNPEVLVNDIFAQEKPMPQIYMACGTEDFLLEHNRQFKRFLEGNNVPLHYEEGPGNHNFRFWGPQLVQAVRWMTAEDGDDQETRKFLEL